MTEPEPPLRLFLAVFPPPELQRALAALRPPRALAASFRPVGTARIHLTLRFLGETSAERLPELRATLAATPWPASFTASPEGLGVFPRIDRARVLWVGCRPRPAFATLAELVDTRLAPLGWEPRREPFVPHLTLGRWRRPPHAGALDRWLRATTPPDDPFPVAELRLVASRLTPAGPEYRTVASFPLATDDPGSI